MQLIDTNKQAAKLMHLMVARMDTKNVLVASHKVLAQLMGCSVATVKRAINDLERDLWVQAVDLSGKGAVKAYVVNSAVAWGDKRDNIPRLSTFHAVVIASEDDQDALTLAHKELRRLPVILPNETQLPAGEGLPPVSQPAFDGMMPELPALRDDKG